MADECLSPGLDEKKVGGEGFFFDLVSKFKSNVHVRSGNDNLKIGKEGKINLASRACAGSYLGNLAAWRQKDEKQYYWKDKNQRRFFFVGFSSVFFSVRQLVGNFVLYSFLLHRPQQQKTRAKKEETKNFLFVSSGKKDPFKAPSCLFRLNRADEREKKTSASAAPPQNNGKK